MILAALVLAATFSRSLERVSTLDPADAQSAYDARVAGLLYETPLAIDYAARPYRLVPGYCELPEVSDDGKTYRFAVRSAGSRNARDVVRSLERLREPTCPNGWLLQDVASVAAPDARTVEIRLKRRVRHFPWLMATPGACVVGPDGEGTGPYRLVKWRKNHEMVFERKAKAEGEGEEKAKVEGEGEERAKIEGEGEERAKIEGEQRSSRFCASLSDGRAGHPVSALPSAPNVGAKIGDGGVAETTCAPVALQYKENDLHCSPSPSSFASSTPSSFASSTPSSFASLRPSSFASSTPLTFATIRYLVIDDASTQWLMFLRGELDFLGEISRDNWDMVVGADGRLVPELAAKGVRLHTLEALESPYVGFNMLDPVVGRNVKLRQALNCAFDYPAWERFYNHRISESRGPVPPGVADRLDEPLPYRFDLAKARRLMSEAGYPDGIDPKTGRRLVLSLAIGRPDQASREMGELMAAFFARIGVKLELSFMTWDAFLTAVNESRVQMYYMIWVLDYPDAQNILQLFYGPNRSPGVNHSNYANPAYDAAFEREDYRTCQAIVREDCPWIFTHYRRESSLTGPHVDNFIPSDFPYGTEQHLRYKVTGNGDAARLPREKEK